MHLPDVFVSSYKAFETYPEKLICRGSFPLALQTYRSRFNNIAPNLFTDDDTTAHVPFRDWVDGTQGKFEVCEILSQANRASVPTRDRRERQRIEAVARRLTPLLWPLRGH